MIWSSFNRSLLRNINLYKPSLTFSFNYLFTLKTQIINNLSQTHHNTFNFSTFQKKQQQIKPSSLLQIFKDYQANHSKLEIYQHMHYFMKVFKSKQKIDEQNTTWHLMNLNLIKNLKCYRYQQITRVLSCLNNAQISNSLTKNTEQIAFQKITYAGLQDLDKLLNHLNTNVLDLNPQKQAQYLKIYNRFQHIIYNKKKNQLKKLINEKVEQKKFIDINTSPIIFTEEKEKFKKQQNQIKMSKDFYRKLCYKIIHAKVIKRHIIQYVCNNPFVNIYASQNLAKTDLNSLNYLFIIVSEAIFKIYFNQKFIPQYPCLKVIIKQIMKRQENINRQKASLHFLDCLMNYTKFYWSVITQKNYIDSKEEKQFEKSLKEYLTQYMNFIYVNRQRQNVKINNLVDFTIKGQAIGVHNQTLFKNVISSAIKQINSLKNKKLSLIPYGLTSMTLEERKKFQELEKVIWTYIWKRYQTFDISTKKNIAKNVKESDKKHNIKIKVPQNIKLVDLSMQQKSSEMQNESENGQIEWTKYQKNNNHNKATFKDGNNSNL